ncbi:class I SAM-dependent methyltransferase [Streptococcus rifensis]
MSKMYYAENPDAVHDVQQLRVKLLSQDFTFWTDSGVFAKKMIDFGSQVLLNNLDFRAGEKVLDVGCGYGPLGIALAKVQGVLPTMVDVNLRALDLARKNADLNGVKASIFQSDGYDQVTDCFDHIISNPPIRAGKQVVHRIIIESIDHLNPNGTFTIVIQKKQGAPSAKAKMEDVFGNVTTLRKEKGYYILQSIKDESC